ncbi:hypothetical protein, partial [Nostoc sp. ChiQUE01b]|uniref:hypothetical protein n=1 Tax=Nostoc sp. ChiQUE01b TaxID=3075376 RepID=UPI002AD46216
MNSFSFLNVGYVLCLPIVSQVVLDSLVADTDNGGVIDWFVVGHKFAFLLPMAYFLLVSIYLISTGLTQLAQGDRKLVVPMY